MCLFLGAVAARIIQVQGLDAKHYAAVGTPELVHAVTIQPSRGTIYDRNGNPVAFSIPQTTIVANPLQITNPHNDATALASILGINEAALESRLSQAAQFSYVARQVSDQQAARVRALKLAGISFTKESKRFLPSGALALPLVGSVGIDGQGLSGLEFKYNRTLAGKPGHLQEERASNGAAIPGGVLGGDQPQSGQGIVVTLDQSLQYEAEQALAAQIAKTKALGGSAIVEDSKTGNILAMASLQAGVNGGAPTSSSSESALTSVFEPGSVLKGVILAGALEDHIVTPATKFSVPDSFSLYGSVFHDAEAHPTEPLSATDILAQSSNVGTINIAKELGKNRINWYLHDFGFGRYSGLGFPAESAGLLEPPSRWTGTSIAAVPIGQDEAVTAVQILDAYNSIANRGVFVPPRLVDAFVTPSGERHAVAPSAGYRVVSQTTADELTAMLEKVVQSPPGTGTQAAIPGYDVAGKTGTAQKPLATGRGYQSGAYMASFVGFVPAQRPALTIMVVLDQPTPIFGGAVAAPVFAQIAKYSLRQLDIPPLGRAGSGGRAVTPSSTQAAPQRFTD